MKLKLKMVAGMIALSAAGFAASATAADGSVQAASTASLGASLLTASAVGWVAYEGSELTVKALQASGDGVVLVLHASGAAVETSAKVAGDLARAASVGVGTSVQVVAESTGHALVASGKVLAFVPNEVGRALIHSSRH